MDTIVLLTELRALVNNIPDFKAYTPTSRDHLEWLGKAHALVAQWDSYEAISVRTSASYVPIDIMREINVGQILASLFRAIAALELQIPVQPDQAFGPGAVYDFLKALRDLMASARKSIFIVDPFLDEQIFDAYITSVSTNVIVRLLARKYATALKPALQMFVAQTKMPVEIRISNAIHDRVVFLDDRTCWVLGQSIKDAAKLKPTYIAPLSSDVAQKKIMDYEQIWSTAALL